MGYLICEECGMQYKLKEGETAEDFIDCECGGELKEVENLENINATHPNNPSMREMINWKYILLGAALVVVLGMVLRFVEFGTFIGMFIPGIIVGYLVNNGYKNGAKNGIITGIIGGFILGFLIYMIGIFNQPPEYNTVVAFIFIFALFNAVTTAILDAIGGIIGTLIRDKM